LLDGSYWLSVICWNQLGGSHGGDRLGCEAGPTNNFSSLLEGEWGLIKAVIDGPMPAIQRQYINFLGD
jgi:hypothetical protein